MRCVFFIIARVVQNGNLSRLLVPSMTLEPFSAPFSRYDLHEWQIGTGTRSLAHVYVQTQAIIP